MHAQCRFCSICLSERGPFIVDGPHFVCTRCETEHPNEGGYSFDSAPPAKSMPTPATKNDYGD